MPLGAAQTPEEAVVATGLASVLVMGVAGCSYSSTTSEGTDGSSSETTTTEQHAIDISSWESSWAGTSSEGDDVFYAQSPNGTQALIVVYTPSTDTLIHMAGAVDVNGEVFA